MLLVSLQQLLHHAYNGKFPNAKAVLLKCKITSGKTIS
jgi:hypothetical protein